MANINELKIGFGFGKQADIATANLLAGIWTLGNLNQRIWSQKPMNEGDAAEIGKGHEFDSTLYKSHYDNGVHQIQKYCSSEFLTWLLAFGCGKVTYGSGLYTIIPQNRTTDGDELPYFSYLQQMRPGGSSVLDQSFVGCAVNAWRILLTSDPGRASAMATADIIHSGKYVEPSTITLPAAPTIHEINSGGLTGTFNGIDYITAKNFVSLEMGMDNNLVPGFFPGSGTQDGYQIQGRLELGARVPLFRFVARYANGSTELTKLRALTTGTATVNLDADANNYAHMTWQQVAFTVAELGESRGIVTVAVTASLQFHSTNGLFSAVCKTPITGIAA